MIRITCDTCGVLRNSRQQGWILGYDLRVDTPQTVSRSISFFAEWDDSRILERGAIHFCSLKCKEDYIARNSMGQNSMVQKTPATKTRGRRSKAA